MLTLQDLQPKNYEEYALAENGIVNVLLDNTLYMLFVMGNGEIIEKPIINNITSFAYVSGSGKYAYLTTNGEVHVVDYRGDRILQKGNFIKLETSSNSTLYAFTKTGAVVFHEDGRKIEIDYGLKITDVRVYHDDPTIVVFMADGDLYIGPYNLRKRWNVTTNGVWYKRFGKHGGAITDVGVVICGTHYILKDEPLHLVYLKNDQYAIVLKDCLLILTIDGHDFRLTHYPIDIPVYDIDFVKDRLLFKSDEGVGVIILDNPH